MSEKRAQMIQICAFKEKEKRGEKQNQIYNIMLEKHPFENSQNLPININIDFTCV